MLGKKFGVGDYPFQLLKLDYRKIIPTLFCIKTEIYLQIAFQFLVPKMPEETI